MKTFTAPKRNERIAGVSCSLCGRDDSRAFLDCDGTNFVKCRFCGLVYQNRQPLFDDLKQRYGAGYFAYELENDENFFDLMKRGLEDIRFHDIPLDTFENRRFLDIGCATGMLVVHMRKLGWEAEGIEICEASARYGIEKRNAKIFVGSLEEAAVPDEKFAVVHFSHLIEHVPDPKRFLEQVKRILTKDGMAIITTPNVDGFQTRLYRSRWRSAIADHLTLFSKRTLIRLCREVGFSIEKSVTWGGLAKGMAPAIIKKPADVLAKKLGFGDVVLLQAIKHSDTD